MKKKVAVLAVDPVNGAGLFQYLESFYEKGISYKVFAVSDNKNIRTTSRLPALLGSRTHQPSRVSRDLQRIPSRTNRRCCFRVAMPFLSFNRMQTEIIILIYYLLFGNFQIRIS